MGWSDRPARIKAFTLGPDYGPPVTLMPVGTDRGPKNKYSAPCIDCGQLVVPFAGHLIQKSSGGWAVRCAGCVGARERRGTEG